MGGARPTHFFLEVAIMEREYQYSAVILDVYDGDTVTAEVDLGFSVKMKMKIRLAEIDTPEIRGEERPAGLIVRDYVRELLLGKEVMIETIKDKTGKYGRYLAFIYIPQEDEFFLNLNEHLVQEGMATRY